MESQPTPSRVRVGTPWSRNPYLRRLALAYAVVWVVSAIAPLDRETWWLENGLVFLMVGALVVTHRRFAFSNLSYTLMFAFLLLHAMGAHYTYSEVPVGNWARDLLGLSRNHYDRFVHFSFGLLMAYPLREITLREVHIHRVWGWLAPPIVVLSLGASYEIVESWAAQLVDPAVGIAYLGAQGDVWDGQKDMTLAVTGAVVAMLVAAAYHRATGREPYLGRSRRAASHAAEL